MFYGGSNQTPLILLWVNVLCGIFYRSCDEGQKSIKTCWNCWILGAEQKNWTDDWLLNKITDCWRLNDRIYVAEQNMECWKLNWKLKRKRCCGRLNYAVPDLCCEFWWELHETSQWIVIYTRRTTLCCSMPKIMLFYATMTEMKMLLKNKRSTTRNYAPPSSLRGTTFNTEETKMKTNNGLWLLT